MKEELKTTEPGLEMELIKADIPAFISTGRLSTNF